MVGRERREAVLDKLVVAMVGDVALFQEVLITPLPQAEVVVE
jgi:hypothetical protein